MSYYDISPTDKQISFVEKICNMLNIDFPKSSLEFNKYTYQQFISTYIEKFREECKDGESFDYIDDEMAWFDPQWN